MSKIELTEHKREAELDTKGSESHADNVEHRLGKI